MDGREFRYSMPDDMREMIMKTALETAVRL